MLSPQAIDALLEEYSRIRPEPGRDELTLLETALFIEETFAIVLSDKELDTGTIGTFDAIRSLIIARRSGT
jgi:hypothetical protein